MKQLILLLALGACTSAMLPSPLPEADQDTCGARQYASVIGQDATVLERVLILGQVRLIRPGTVVTMDFRPTRINFGIDSNERISRITCG